MTVSEKLFIALLAFVLRAFPHLARTIQCLGTSRTLPKRANHPSQVGE